MIQFFHKYYFMALGCLVAAILQAPISASATEGCVVAWSGQTPQLIRVELPPFSGGGIGNELVQVETSGKNGLVDPSGPLCFALDDERLVQIDTYYWATSQIQFYNQVFKRIGVAPMKQVKLRLVPTSQIPLLDDEGGSASVEKNAVTLVYRRPALDTTILFHEMGHLIQAHLEGASKDQASSVEQQSINEGFADLIVAFFSGETVMFPRKLGCEPSRDINELIRYPKDALTFEQEIRRLIARDGYKESCPKSYGAALKMLSGEIPVPLNEFEPHHLSRVVSRPVWRAFQNSSADRDLFFLSFVRHEITTFSGLVDAVFEETKGHHALQATMIREFQEVGLNHD